MSTPEESEPVQPEASAVSAGADAVDAADAIDAAGVADPAGAADAADAVALPSREPEFATDVTDETVTVRRTPRYGRFIVLGAALGAVVALILTFAFPENEQFDRGQVFGFLLLGLGAVGAAFGAAVALVFDRVLAGRRGQAIVAHESTHPVE